MRHALIALKNWILCKDVSTESTQTPHDGTNTVSFSDSVKRPKSKSQFNVQRLMNFQMYIILWIFYVTEWHKG